MGPKGVRRQYNTRIWHISGQLSSICLFCFGSRKIIPGKPLALFPSDTSLPQPKPFVSAGCVELLYRPPHKPRQGGVWVAAYLEARTTVPPFPPPTLKLRFCVGDLDLPARRKRHASSRKEEEIAQMCPCGKAVESRTHIVGGCEIYMEDRDVLEEMRTMDECNMEKFGTLR